MKLILMSVALAISNSVVMNFGTILSSGASGAQSGGTAGAVGGIIQGFGNMISQDVQSKDAWNRYVYGIQKQRQWSLEDREHYENYNRPLSQLQRMREAGINPMFSAENIQPSESSVPQIPSGEVPSVPDPMAAISAASQSILSGEQLKIDRSNVKVAEAQNILKSRELDQQKEMNDQKIKESEANIELLHATSGLTKEQQNVAFYSAQLMRKDVESYEDKLRAELNLKNAEISFKEALTLTENKLRDARKRNIEASTSEMYQHIELMKKQGKLTDEQSEVAKYSWGVLMQQYQENIPHWQAQLLSGEITAQQYANKIAKLNALNAHKFMKYELERAKLDANHLGYFVRNVWSPLFTSFAMGYGAMKIGAPIAPTGYVQGVGYQYDENGKLQSTETYRNYR